MSLIDQICNPYLLSYEYIPDGEPYEFGERLYIFGSHHGSGSCGNRYCSDRRIKLYLCGYECEKQRCDFVFQLCRHR